ncbi:MAG: hypothetical protein RLZZ350_2120 [Verrucomicrobiota bacterium]
MKVATKRQTKSKAELLDEGTNNLLRAIKEKMLKQHGQVDYSKLRKDGYSDQFLAKMEQA